MISKVFRQRAEVLKRIAEAAIKELYPQSTVRIEFQHEHRRELIDEVRFFIHHPSNLAAWFNWSIHDDEGRFIKTLILCCREITNEVILKHEQKLKSVS